MTSLQPESVATLVARVEAARAARARLRDRPLAETVAALAAAARRWQNDAELGAALPVLAGLSPAMITAVLPLAAEALDTGAMTALVEHELGPGAARRPPPPGPALVAHVLASNVPALALPAIALSCLAGAAVLVKSGRADPLSAPAFVRALAAVDPDLAATVVATYWPRGDERDQIVLDAADVVCVSGGDEAIAALARRVRGTLLAHGPRVSAAAIGQNAPAETVAAVALQVVLHDQRGCLSPHAAYVEADSVIAPPAFAEALAAALGELASRLPPGEANVEERAARRIARAAAEWEGDVQVFENEGGTVLYTEKPTVLRPTIGRRTIRVHSVASLAAIPAALPADGVECIGLAGGEPTRLGAGLEARGVSRLCPIERMQRPPLAWPRGRYAPLGALLGRLGRTALQLEP